MTAPLDLDAIEARAAAAEFSSNPAHQAASSSDVPALVAEVRRLRAQVEGLNRHQTKLGQVAASWQSRADVAEAEVTRLQRRDDYQHGECKRLYDEAFVARVQHQRILKLLPEAIRLDRISPMFAAEIDQLARGAVEVDDGPMVELDDAALAELTKP